MYNIFILYISLPCRVILNTLVYVEFLVSRIYFTSHKKRFLEKVTVQILTDQKPLTMAWSHCNLPTSKRTKCKSDSYFAQSSEESDSSNIEGINNEFRNKDRTERNLQFGKEKENEVSTQGGTNASSKGRDDVGFFIESIVSNDLSSPERISSDRNIASSSFQSTTEKSTKGTRVACTSNVNCKVPSRFESTGTSSINGSAKVSPKNLPPSQSEISSFFYSSYTM